MKEHRHTSTHIHTLLCTKYLLFHHGVLPLPTVALISHSKPSRDRVIAPLAAGGPEMSPLERLAREDHLLQPSCQLLACGKQLPEALLHSCTDGAKSPAVHTVDTLGVMN